MKTGLHRRLKVQLRNHLGDAISHRGHPENPYSPVLLRYFNYFDRRREIAPRRHAIPDLVEIIFEILFKSRDRFIVDSRRTLVRFYSFVCIHYDMLGNLRRLCFVHRFLPRLGGLTNFQNQMTQPLCSAPITGASSLIRAVPPLYSASVLASLWVFHLDFSLNIGVVGSHVPHKSLCHVHAAFMPATTRTVGRYPPDLSQVNDSPLVSMTVLRFRHFISGSLVFVSIALT